MNLPLVRSRQEAIVLPPAVLDALMETAGGSIEGAQYFVSRYTENLGKKASPQLIEKLNEWEKLVCAGLKEPESQWNGQYVERSQQTTSLMNLSEDAIKQANVAEVDNLHLDFAINQESQFVRAYSSNNEALSEEAQDAMDFAFNAWLDEQNITARDGVLYQIENKERGAVADPLKIEKLIQHENRGFKAYMQNQGIRLDIEQQEYPTSDSAPAA